MDQIMGDKKEDGEIINLTNTEFNGRSPLQMAKKISSDNSNSIKSSVQLVR